MSPPFRDRLFAALFTIGKAATFLLAAVLLSSAVSVALAWLGVPAEIQTAVLALTAFAATWICMRLFEGLSVWDAGLYWSTRNTVWGLLGGLAMAGLVTLLPAATPAAEFVPAQPEPAYYVPVLAGAAAGEELLTRGYLLLILARLIRFWPAALLTSVLFGMGHLGNTAASWASITNTVLAGLALAAAVYRTGELWFAIGMHFGWNLMLALTGATLSGYQLELFPVRLQYTMDEIWSGGRYGPEGGLLTTFAFLTWFLFVWKAPVERRPSVLLQPAAPPSNGSSSGAPSSPSRLSDPRAGL
ncbi:MAG: type II CAAX endopeptidase family protein [Bryobacteraceae bacterium]|nr:type II CAAX endopeptidase family protein [Bryobacteraceae bacterium]